MPKSSKPKRTLSAYCFFIQICREEFKTSHPNGQVNFAEFSKNCALRWKDMSVEQKKRFQNLAAEDKKRYEMEMMNYKPEVDDKSNTKKRKKDQNAPKRPMSAYLLFCQDERPKIKESFPAMDFKGVAQELARRWAQLIPQAKSNFEEKAAEAKVKYDKEMEIYRK